MFFTVCVIVCVVVCFHVCEYAYITKNILHQHTTPQCHVTFHCRRILSFKDSKIKVKVPSQATIPVRTVVFWLVTKMRLSPAESTPNCNQIQTEAEKASIDTPASITISPNAC